MGAAARHRGDALIRRQADAAQPEWLAILLHDLDSLPRDPDASAPFETVKGLTLSPGHGGWWLTCNTTGFGYWYRTLRLALRGWLVDIVAVDEGALSFQCQPWSAARIRAFRSRNAEKNHAI